jgi:hypothetical protein
VAFKAPDTIASNVTWTLPSADGTSAQVLSTNGSGTLSWATASGGSSQWTTTGSDIYYTTGNVGIGTSSPFATAKLQIKTATNINVAFQTGTVDSTGGKLNAFNDAASANVPLEINGSILRFNTSETERARIPTAGGFQVVTALSVGNATPTTSGAGITFPATQSASSDANTLDDYEEGTWTPVVAGSTTAGSIAYSYQYGYYTKIGRLVYVYFDVDVSSFSGGAGGLTITSFPFPAANLTNFFSTFQPWAVASAYAQTYTTPTGIVNPNGSLMNMYSTDDEHANFAAMNVNQTGRISGYVVMQTA